MAVNTLTPFRLSPGPLLSWSDDKTFVTTVGESVLVSSPLSGTSTRWDTTAARPAAATRPYSFARTAWGESEMLAVLGGDAPVLAVSNDRGTSWQLLDNLPPTAKVLDAIFLRDGDARNDNRYMLLVFVRLSTGRIAIFSWFMGRPTADLDARYNAQFVLNADVADVTVARVPIGEQNVDDHQPRQQGAVFFSQIDTGYIQMSIQLLASASVRRTYVNYNAAGAKLVAGAAVQSGGNSGPVGWLNSQLAFATDANNVLGAKGITSSSTSYTIVTQSGAPAEQVRDLNGVSLEDSQAFVCVTAGTFYRFIVNVAGNEFFEDYALPRTGDWEDAVGWDDGTFALVDSAGGLYWYPPTGPWEQVNTETDDPIVPPDNDEGDGSGLSTGVLVGLIVGGVALLALVLGLGLGLGLPALKAAKAAKAAKAVTSTT